VTARTRLLLATWALLVIGLSIRALGRGLVGDRWGAELSLRPAVIDLNTASVAELSALPGVGGVRAEAIVLDRIRRGSFQTIEELDRVDGLGAGTVDLVRPFVACRRSVRDPAR
jgi:competence protein ComEA